jgi:hypothetical protein
VAAVFFVLVGIFLGLQAAANFLERPAVIGVRNSGRRLAYKGIQLTRRSSHGSELPTTSDGAQAIA